MACAALAAALAARTAGAPHGPRRAPDGAAAATAPHARRLTLYTEPKDGVEPVLTLIAQARRRIELSMYELSDPRVERALADAAARDVAVRVILDERGHEPRRENGAARAYLLAHGVATRWAPSRFALDHEKALAVDGRVALIMTFNLTPRYYASDRDFAVLDRRRAEVSVIEGSFAADWLAAGGGAYEKAGAIADGGLRADAEAARRELASRSAGGLVFSPGAAPRLLALLTGARRSVQLESEELDAPQIVAALCADARRGVSVEVTMSYETSEASSLARLARCGARVHLFAEEAPLYIHAKAIVVDRRLAFVGSENLSTQSLDFDRELGIVFEAARLVRALSATLASDFARAG
ncbi:MAG: phospholipase D-like domain-containing protein [Solirubrobacteraceae bacterium]